MSYLLETGILLNGQRLPGTDWILRDSRAWFAADDADAPPRRHWPVTTVTYHWTGGAAKVGPEAGRDVVRNMKARKRDDGSLMSVSCHFVVSWDGMVFQVADLARMTIHAGRVLNRDGIGVEQCWPGYEGQMLKLGGNGGVQRRLVNGSRVDCMMPSPLMLEASMRLAETLASLPSSTRIAVPRVVAPQRRLRPAEAAAFRGACEHASSPGSGKLDCAWYVTDALAANGWQRAV